MCRFFSTLLIIAVVAGGAYVALSKNPRAQVAREQILGKVDKVLGETKVQRKQIEQAIENLEETQRNLNTERIKKQVELEKFVNPEIDKLEQDLVDARDALRTLRSHLQVGNPEALIAGKTLTLAQVESDARQLLAEGLRLEAELKAKKNYQRTLQDILARFKNRETGLATEVASLRSELRIIDDKIKELRALQSAKQTAGETDQNLAGEVELVSQQMRELHIRVEAQREQEQEQWQARTSSKPESVQEIIARNKGVNNTLAEVDAFLGAEK
jgi:hypothetical protein